MITKSISELGFAYSLHIAELVRYLQESGKKFPLHEKLLDCGVKAGFYSRDPEQKQAMLQYTKETDYIIQMALHAGYLSNTQTVHIRKECECLLSQLCSAMEDI